MHTSSYHQKCHPRKRRNFIIRVRSALKSIASTPHIYHQEVEQRSSWIDPRLLAADQENQRKDTDKGKGKGKAEDEDEDTDKGKGKGKGKAKAEDEDTDKGKGKGKAKAEDEK
ncbi:hypothetical protein LTS17_009676 [Exophiala oligosperma]